MTPFTGREAGTGATSSIDLLRYCFEVEKLGLVATIVNNTHWSNSFQEKPKGGGQNVM